MPHPTSPACFYAAQSLIKPRRLQLSALVPAPLGFPCQVFCFTRADVKWLPSLRGSLPSFPSFVSLWQHPLFDLHVCPKFMIITCEGPNPNKLLVTTGIELPIFFKFLDKKVCGIFELKRLCSLFNSLHVGITGPPHTGRNSTVLTRFASSQCFCLLESPFYVLF